MSNETKSKKTRDFTGSTTGKPPKTTYAKDYQFIEGYLDEKDRQWLSDNMDSQHERILELVCDLPVGFKFSLSWDARSERFLATLTNNDVTSADFHKILTSRGATPDAATFALWYRHNVKFQAGWGESRSNDSLFD